MKLHHTCMRVAPDKLDVALACFHELGCPVTDRPPGEDRWAMVGQGGHDIQLKEEAPKPFNPWERSRTHEQVVRDQLRKIQAHVALVAYKPKEAVDDIEDWAARSGVRFARGAWSERELWFDLPDVFVDWVVEVFHVEVDDGISVLS